jgi:hypothetical protein
MPVPDLMKLDPYALGHVRDSHPADENYPEFETGKNRTFPGPIPHSIPHPVAAENGNSDTRDETRTRKARRPGDFESTDAGPLEAARDRATALSLLSRNASTAQTVREPQATAGDSPLDSPPRPRGHTDFLTEVIRLLAVPPARVNGADLHARLVDLQTTVSEMAVVGLPAKRRYHARFAMAFAAEVSARAYWLAREIEALAAAERGDA